MLGNVKKKYKKISRPTLYPLNHHFPPLDTMIYGMTGHNYVQSETEVLTMIHQLYIRHRCEHSEREREREREPK